MITDARAVACRSCRSTERPLIDNFCMSCRFDLVAAKPIKSMHPYQQTSVEYLTQNPNTIISHSPGLGKSIIATEAAVLNTPPTWRIVVFTSALLTEQWYDFIRAQYPFDTVSLIGAGSKVARIQALRAVPHARWYIFNYEIVRGNDYFELLKQLPIYTLILDESHHVKNRPQRKIAPDRSLTYTPLQSKRIFEIGQLSTVRARYLLTATPIVREADDLFWQLHILDPLKFASYDNFLRDYCYANWTSYGPADIVLNKAAERLLRATYIHGYSYEDVGMYLPPLISDVLPVPMEPELKTKYNELRDFWRTEFRSGDPDSRFTIDNAMAAMHSLRHMTALSSAKLAALLDKFDNTPGPHIIFCHYKDSAKRVAAAIAAHQRTHQDVSGMFSEDPTTSHHVPHAPKPPALITGGVPPDDRSSVAKSSDVVVATINSLTEGVDLSRAKTVLFFEEDFTPGRMYQALSRVRRTDHRPDDDAAHHVVLCYYICAAHTIDATIHKKQTGRATSIKDILSVELS